jgi:peptidyl-prolyl cis-trans isomerase C
MQATRNPEATMQQRLLRHLRERALSLGLGDASMGDEQRFEALLEHDLRVPEPSEEECRRYHEAHADELRQGALAEADHILFAVTDTTPIEALRRHAEGVLDALLAGEAEFAQLARAESNCPSAQVGGNLGQLTRKQCVPEFWAALAQHGQEGLLPRLVPTRFGLHVVRLHRFDAGRLPPFEQLHAVLAERLRQQSLVRAMSLYAEDLRRQIENEPAAA